MAFMEKQALVKIAMGFLGMAFVALAWLLCGSRNRGLRLICEIGLVVGLIMFIVMMVAVKAAQ